MPIADVHTHVFPDDIAASAISVLEAEGHGIKATFDGTISGLLEIMDASGIDIAVTQPVATKPGQVKRINDWAAKVGSPRIVPFGAMHPDLERPDMEIARMASMGLRGFKLHSEYQRFAPDEERMAPIYESAREHGMTILFHAGLDIGIPTLHGTPESFSRMLDAWPGLSAILAHMGGFRLWERVRECLIGRDVYMDTSYSLKFMSSDAFVDLARAHGVDRVLFGTDAPWEDVSAEVARIREAGLTSSELDAVMWHNAARLLSLAGPDPALS